MIFIIEDRNGQRIDSTIQITGLPIIEHGSVKNLVIIALHEK
jgi:hypothetical protein